MSVCVNGRFFSLVIGNTFTNPPMMSCCFPHSRVLCFPPVTNIDVTNWTCANKPSWSMIKEFMPTFDTEIMMAFRGNITVVWTVQRIVICPAY